MSKLDSIKLADYTRTEDWINSISHMVGGGLSVLATLLCIYKAFKAWSWQYLIAALIYGLTMIAMYTCSAVYHALRPNNGKKAMRMVDHSMIYLMIAGTITPFAWLVIMPVNFKAGVAVLAVAWVTVVIAMFMTFFLFNTTKTIQMILYLALGWMIIVCVRILWSCIDHRAVYLLGRYSLYSRCYTLRYRCEEKVFSQRVPLLCACRLNTSFLLVVFICVCSITNIQNSLQGTFRKNVPCFLLLLQ